MEDAIVIASSTEDYDRTVNSILPSSGIYDSCLCSWRDDIRIEDIVV